MPTFLFWNINRRPIHAVVARLAAEHKVDVLILAENRVPVGEMLQTLNGEAPNYRFAESGAPRISVFTRLPQPAFREVATHKRASAWGLRLANGTDMLLAAVHLWDPVNYELDERNRLCREFAAWVSDIEARQGHDRTIVAGDFNLNPFDDGLFTATGFHAVMSRGIASRRTRVFAGRSRRFFYNPMWRYFAEVEGRPPGTHYFDRSKERPFFWNMFDQVLVRPALLPVFRDTDVSILTSGAGGSLLDKDGLLSDASVSDHLPVLFSLDLTSGA